jgi:ABC-type uncharacterized transport system auxiliary subunit
MFAGLFVITIILLQENIEQSKSDGNDKVIIYTSSEDIKYLNNEYWKYTHLNILQHSVLIMMGKKGKLVILSSVKSSIGTKVRDLY